MLLSSLQGAAVTSVRIDGVQHEFSTIPNVKEDTIEFLLNVKEMRLRALSDRPGTLVLDISGREGAITAADIQVPEHYEIVNTDLYLATVNSPMGGSTLSSTWKPDAATPRPARLTAWRSA